MNIGDYKHADCERFRLPPIDVSEFETSLQEAILKAWQDGESADFAMQEILTSSDAAVAIQDRIADNLTYQKEMALDGIAAEAEDKKDSYEEQKDRASGRVTEQYQGMAEEAQQNLSGATENVQEQRAAYTKAQSALDEMRRRAEDRIRSLGGVAVYETLKAIKGELSKPGLEDSVKEPTATSGQPDSIDEKMATAETFIGPQKPEPIYGPQKPDSLSSEESILLKDGTDTALYTRVLRSISNSAKFVWKILNYRIG